MLDLVLAQTANSNEGQMIEGSQRMMQCDPVHCSKINPLYPLCNALRQASTLAQDTVGIQCTGGRIQTYDECTGAVLLCLQANLINLPEHKLISGICRLTSLAADCC